MNSEIRYRFQSAQIANRFLNELKDWPIAKVKTRLLNGGFDVKVSYQFDGTGFDYTCSELDDLASQHQGVEVN
ncbi:MAG: hypothetical protein ACPG5Z_16485 [Pseudoalteromonas sp.]|uniref:hypothetical protein n=1 Tax=Pseudoalteromonas TaxID=53246 RepID=UPI000C072522|nr:MULTISPECIES: hypothetical protein [unclassified Pseudoalteromonas]MDB2356110.1 hypothetical protein [Pseudoalteromonas sp.]MDP2633818.1 hypothetical protein [Pseudoalteromonas sp. 1_MG-2023]PHN88977.1 hypothetical protein CSC79_15060 [Pseudoalteromonas sp. 3D05]